MAPSRVYVSALASDELWVQLTGRATVDASACGWIFRWAPESEVPSAIESALMSVPYLVSLWVWAMGILLVSAPPLVLLSVRQLAVRQLAALELAEASEPSWWARA
jgi:hypothetical protein